MPIIALPLLGNLNSSHRGNGASSLVPKYVCSITAEYLSTLLAYSRIGKKFPFQIQPSSVITVDHMIQRGLTDEGCLHQDAAKIDEIKSILLGADNARKKAFLGTLVWNVREDAAFKVVTVSSPGDPPERELRIDTSQIYLTDSAHRHLGVCEAYREYARNKSKYPKFDPKYEFSVEIYNLGPELENQLFEELNSKQKKISATKQKQIDVITPVGLMKTRILAYDMDNDGLFSQNIEVNTVTNERHTLMTMSVFTAAIKEMFSDKVLKDAADDDLLRDELAKYFCEFFYALRDTITINCRIRGQDQEVQPFESLYQRFIEPVENKDFDDETKREQELAAAREKAKELNKSIRDEDKINSNPFIRCLAYIGGQVIEMEDWKQCIDKLQTDIIAPAGGKFFQASNSAMTAIDPDTGHPMATKLDDGSLNVQVQQHTLRTIRKFLENKLELKRPSNVYLRYQQSEYTFIGEQAQFTVPVDRNDKTYIDILIEFYVGSNYQVNIEDLKLRQAAWHFARCT